MELSTLPSTIFLFYLCKCTPNSTFHCVYKSLTSLPNNSKWLRIGHPLPQFCSVNLTDDEAPKYRLVAALRNCIGVSRFQWPVLHTTIQSSPKSVDPSRPKPDTSCWLLNGLRMSWVWRLVPVTFCEQKKFSLSNSSRLFIKNPKLTRWFNRMVFPQGTGAPVRQAEGTMLPSSWASRTCHRPCGERLSSATVTNCCPLPIVGEGIKKEELFDVNVNNIVDIN